MSSFPDHDWNGDKYGHACVDCDQESPWYCDRVAHRIGEHDRGLKLLDAVKEGDN